MFPIKSVIYSIPYLILTLSFIICAFLIKNRKFDKSFFCLLCFFVFFGLRGFVGWDWYNYYPWFNNLEPLYGNIEDNFKYVSDIGFTIYGMVIKTFFDSFSIFIGISVLIDCLVLNYIFKKYSANYAFSFAVYIFACLAIEMDTLRSMKALELFLLAVPYIQNRKLVKYLVFIGIAISFHASAVLYLPCYWYMNRSFNKQTLIVIFFIINVIYLLQIPIIKPVILQIGNIIGGRMTYMINFYSESDIYNSSRGITPSYLERLITLVLVLYYYDKIVRGNKGNVIFINMFLTYLGIVLFGSEMNIIETRVGAMFIFSYTIIWPAILSVMKNQRNKKLISSWFIIACLVFVCLRTNNIMYMYENRIFDARTYEERSNIFDYAQPKMDNL